MTTEHGNEFGEASLRRADAKLGAVRSPKQFQRGGKNTDTKRIEYETALGMYKAEQEEMDAVLGRILGKYGMAKRHPRELRRKLAKQLDGISVSQMIVEAR